ncbi:MAG TPA: zinc-binding dehydrogenase [Candidatus Limnocylindrales bacterium]
MRIHGAVLAQAGVPGPYAETRALEVREIELGEPGTGEVLVRIVAAGLCHSDLSVIDGSRIRPLPMLLGHEASGVVEAIGADVTDVVPGDHVVLSYVPSCGGCVPCLSGRPALCEPAMVSNGAGTLRSGVRRLRSVDDDEPLNHHLGVSAFADHAVVSQSSLVRIDPDADLALAAVLGCAVLTGVGAFVNTASPRPGSSAVVFGLGGVGLSGVMGARLAGCHPIVAVDVVDAKLDLAMELGATHAVRADDPDALARIREITAGGGETVVEAVGRTAVLEMAFDATRRGGTTVAAGLPAPDAVMALSPLRLVAEERTLKGSYMGSGVPRRDVPRLLALARSGRLPIDRLVSGRLQLDGINEGFDRLADGTAVRQLLTFD